MSKPVRFKPLAERYQPDLSMLNQFLDADDPRPAKEQLHEAYMHGGGWRPFDGFKMNEIGQLTYTGDPPTKQRAVATLRDETIILYEHDWVAIIQKDGSFEVCRMD